MSKQNVTRRQFLNYTLTGVGGFMAAGMIMPMVRFAIDPVLKAEASGDFVATKMKVSELTGEPVRVDYSFDQKDGWYETSQTNTAWVYKTDDGKIVALSPICKHLGCTVAWNTDKENPNQFFCPCHYGRYTKDGVNVKGTPPIAPLDLYATKEKDGILYLGQLIPQ
ncbi:ubiquinol-cytochrome c reductase iron-sulfur subunit [Peribacillus psychrosaccharolyticus]|uniref:Menaquinol:cytochrome c reductase iron-sulfur subunit n=1 Tax=Peribacillus psychrosaccharolyticus TaxID=1407 RepID=A0A974S023_PERPY|nr:ubiquinol-cytochrome c reductase iron-sulfur subunit [Peribacillus psychrosaccharolyticus]MEC2056711.1 ubiquinol-cytochrome c reductase iron-sulfur subunit [Peribacillus psychrosaccharolyticus]MED3746165.1 ubiquinol-cytochrome c reductase iron-sulfur subunit [Peribacillus psychrosaccharolyticus]QQT00162.1 ubiquinol-cytochrome c reductase iron-sulfur subunit [Peribacillus psychrosaccharolyticus]